MVKRTNVEQKQEKEARRAVFVEGRTATLAVQMTKDSPEDTVQQDADDISVIVNELMLRPEKIKAAKRAVLRNLFSPAAHIVAAGMLSGADK